MPVSQPEGYLAMPPSNQGDPVLVLHAWWGLNDTIRAFCTRLAEAGFVAFAPDLYHGKVATTIADAEVLSSALDERVEQARRQIDDAVAYLRERAPGARGIAVIGFSLGAFYALDLCCRSNADIDRVVIFYGSGPADCRQSRAAYMGHFASDDPYEPAANVAELKSELDAAGSPATFYTYPGTGHWFFEPDRADAYNAHAAQLAWSRTLAFLRGEPHT